MNDREQVITTLTEHLNHWKRLLSEGVCTKDEGERTINALTFAIESIKVDRAYDLAYEKVDFIEIPEGATNGDMIKALFPKAYFHDMAITVHATTNVTSNGVRGGISYDFWKDWWNSPYRKEN